MAFKKKEEYQKQEEIAEEVKLVEYITKSHIEADKLQKATKVIPHIKGQVNQEYIFTLSSDVDVKAILSK